MYPITSFLHAMTSWLPEALILDEAIENLRTSAFSPITNDCIRLAITADAYLDGIPIIVEKTVVENDGNFEFFSRYVAEQS